MMALADVPLLDAVKMASATPAKILNIQDRKGELVKGKDADIVIFDDEINIDTTMVKGNVVYSKDKIKI